MSFISEDGRKRLEHVALWLEAGAPHVKVEGQAIDGFNMSYGVYVSAKCGTVCCIAGAVCQFNHPFSMDDYEDGYDNRVDGIEAPFWPNSGDGVFFRAIELLEISEDDAETLFTPEIPYSLITADDAAKTIRKFLETGVVDWDVQRVK